MLYFFFTFFSFFLGLATGILYMYLTDKTSLNFALVRSDINKLIDKLEAHINVPK